MNLNPYYSKSNYYYSHLYLFRKASTCDFFFVKCESRLITGQTQ